MAEHPNQQQRMSHPVAKAAAAATAGGSMLLLSGLTLAGTVIALTVATPLLVIFSPVLVPATIATLLLAAGFVSSAGLLAAALSVLLWMYKYLTGQHPPGADQLDRLQMMPASKAHEAQDTAQQRPPPQQVSRPVVRETAEGSGSMLTRAGTVIGLTVASPLLVILSPVLVPVAIVVVLLMAWFVPSGGMLAAAASGLSWMYNYVTGKHPVGADQLDHARMKLAGMARGVTNTTQQSH